MNAHNYVSGRACQTCGLAVGTYEPAVFIIGDEVIHSSRAADPSLATQPGVRSAHQDCYSQPGPGADQRGG